MAVFSPKSEYLTRYHVRSFRLFSRSNPITTRIEQVLAKIQVFGASSKSKAESIYTSLSGLQELQQSIQELLIFEPLAQKSLSSYQLEILVKLLEESVMYVDVCSNIRVVIMTMKEGVEEVQSALRRRRRVGGDPSIVNGYISTRKKTEKEIYKSLANLKRTWDNHRNIRVFPMPDFDEHCLSASTLKFLEDASARTASILQSLVSYLSVPVSLKPKPRSRWSLVSKFLHTGLVESKSKKDYLNELQEVEVELSHFLYLQHGSNTCDELDSQERTQSVLRKLEAVDATFEGLEIGLGSLFRVLINIRVSLLNIVSDQ